MVNKVLFSYADTKLYLPNKTGVKQSIIHLCQQEAKPLERLQYVFCTDAFLLSINQQYLQHNTYTDIITFNLSNEPNIIEGEIYISVERVKENSITHQTGFNQEMLRVLFHGALHLCGYGDKTKTEKTIMRSKEDFYIEQSQHLW